VLSHLGMDEPIQTLREPWGCDSREDQRELLKLCVGMIGDLGQFQFVALKRHDLEASSKMRSKIPDGECF